MTYQLYLGDCLDFMRGMDAGSVDAVITDFPYAIDYPYSMYKDTLENLLTLIKNGLPEMRRVAKRVAIFCGVQNICLYPQPDWIMSWNWNTTATYGSMGYNQWQPVLIYGKDVRGFGSVNGILKSDVVSINGRGGIGFMRDAVENAHVCSKPLNVMRLFIERLSLSGESIADFIMGGGTTGVACMQLGRNFIGCEIDPNYYAIAEKRISAAAAQPPLFTLDAPRIEYEQDQLL